MTRSPTGPSCDILDTATSRTRSPTSWTWLQSGARTLLRRPDNVGIGTTNPSVALHVKGDGDRVQVSSADYDLVKLGAYGDSGGNLDNGFLKVSALFGYWVFGILLSCVMYFSIPILGF